MSDREVVAVKGGAAARLFRVADGRGDNVSVCGGTAGIVESDAPVVLEADAMSDGAEVDGAATGGRLVAAPQAVSIPMLATNISVRGITYRD